MINALASAAVGAITAVGIIGGAIVVMGTSGPHRLTNAERLVAEGRAQAWLDQLPKPGLMNGCRTLDPSNDGTTICAGFMPRARGRAEAVLLRCPYRKDGDCTIKE